MDYTREVNAVYLLRQIYESLSSLTKKIDKHEQREDNGMTARQFMTLQVISQLPPEEATMGNISAKMGTTKQNTNKLIPKLEKKGYVFRTAGIRYKKSAILIITDLGRQKMEEYSAKSTTIAATVFKNFTDDEIDTLLFLLRKLK